MSLEQKINDDIKKAMLAKDSRKLEAIRGIKAALLILKTGKDVDHTGEIPESLEMSTLQRLVKQRKESAEIYRTGGRNDLAEEEQYQASIIEAYLPSQMSEAEVRDVVKKIIAETGATSIKEMGKVMGMASKQLAGRADNRTISEIVKSILTP
jgi:hypothetical protein